MITEDNVVPPADDVDDAVVADVVVIADDDCCCFGLDSDFRSDGGGGGNGVGESSLLYADFLAPLADSCAFEDAAGLCERLCDVFEVDVAFDAVLLELPSIALPADEPDDLALPPPACADDDPEPLFAFELLELLCVRSRFR